MRILLYLFVNTTFLSIGCTFFRIFRAILYLFNLVTQNTGSKLVNTIVGVTAVVSVLRLPNENSTT